MNLSLTNRDDIVANSLPIITFEGPLLDVLDAVQGSIVGLPPSKLNMIEQLSGAISDDPNKFQPIQTAVLSKAPVSTTYTRAAVDAALALKSDKSKRFKGHLATAPRGSLGRLRTIICPGISGFRAGSGPVPGGRNRGSTVKCLKYPAV